MGNSGQMEDSNLGLLWSRIIMGRKWICLTSFVLALGLLCHADDLIAGGATPVSVEDFETGDFNKFPWRSSGDASWVTTRQESHSGTYSAESGSIEDHESTSLQVTLDCAPGNITFYRKVYSESYFDKLMFKIDGVEKGTWSGEEDWAEVSFPVVKGIRTFEWTYSKDSSISEGDDSAWIDDIVFPIVPYSHQPQSSGY